MAANLNKVFLIGNLTRDPELKYTSSGTAVANFGMAINRKYTDANGEKSEDVCFIEIVAWNRLAEVAGEHLSKGRPVFVEGRLQMDSWEQEDGQKRSKLKVVAQSIQFLGGVAKAEDDSSGQDPGDDIPF
jgi:single-strand DNA-binding protein